MNFTSDNILLDNGTTTLGSGKILLANSAVWTSIKGTLDLFLSNYQQDPGKIRVADLGCLEGGYSVEFARLGFDTIGFEAREDNIAKCNYVKANLNLPNLNFVKDDVRNLPNYGKFDIVLCYGLLYHLNDPINFLNRVGACTKKLLMLNTHFAPERDIRYELGFLNNWILAPIQKRTKFLEFQQNYRLSPITINEGYRGRWYKEWNQNTDKKKVDKMLWSSYDNPKSFWLCKKDLTKAIHAAGFDNVFEQFNYTGDLLPDHDTQYRNRAVFVGIKK
jgi:SAM-dependent methyltransferase